MSRVLPTTTEGWVKRLQRHAVESVAYVTPQEARKLVAHLRSAAVGAQLVGGAISPMRVPGQFETVGVFAGIEVRVRLGVGNRGRRRRVVR